MWGNDHMAPQDLQEVLGQVDSVYGQGPPSVASGPRTYTHPGYDGVPIDEMQGMGIGSHPGSTYGQVQDINMDNGDINFDQDMPQPPQDNNQVAAWYDTDL